MKELELYSNEIGAAGAIAIAESLKFNETAHERLFKTAGAVNYTPFPSLIFAMAPAAQKSQYCKVPGARPTPMGPLSLPSSARARGVRSPALR